MLKIKDLKTLMKLKTNNKDGDLALVEETRTLYKWDGTNWNIHKPKGGINVSLYELNQSTMTAAPALSHDEIENRKQFISKMVYKSNSKYFMLLNNETKYYTVFLIGCDTGTDFNYSPIEDEVIECLQSLGEIKDISLLENNSVEFWVTKDSNSYVYYLFDYQGGIVKCQ